MTFPRKYVMEISIDKVENVLSYTQMWLYTQNNHFRDSSWYPFDI